MSSKSLKGFSNWPWNPLVIHIFDPLMTRSSPTLFAVVLMLATSLPAPGSLTPMQETCRHRETLLLNLNRKISAGKKKPSLVTGAGIVLSEMSNRTTALEAKFSEENLYFPELIKKGSYTVWLIVFNINAFLNSFRTVSLDEEVVWNFGF